MRMWPLVLLAAAVPVLELAVDRPGSPDGALVVRVRNPPGHRPIGLLREFWKHEAIRCTLWRGPESLSAVALRPDRPTLVQLVVLDPLAEYTERLPLVGVWGEALRAPGAYHAECRVGTRVDPLLLQEASIHGGVKRASAGLAQDLKRVDFALADVKPAALEFTIK
jgi:hypothetical protein